MGHSLDELLRLAAAEKVFRTGSCSHSWQKQVPPRFELGSLDSKSRVLTITPWNPRSPSDRSERRAAAWLGGGVWSLDPLDQKHTVVASLPKPGIEPGTFRSSV
ncbi:hypothetical protein ABG768_021507 [Culter alburnus]|uniref:Uncharacterized protein n=1 Tax=Culter alburnus TaxID=194366 RepID=A0AAW2AS64_CULAL